MNKRDAELIGDFVAKMIAAPAHLRDPLIARLISGSDTIGTLGTGICICPSSPERVREIAVLWNFETVNFKILLDHRCPHHGEKAQPALWGRHNEKILEVRAAEWLSLGITHEVKST